MECVSPQNSRIHSLDILRSLAITGVFLNHLEALPAIPILKTMKSFGPLGVDLFFVLSAYLISTQWFERQKNQKPYSFLTFFLRRGLRIWPNYYFLLTLFSLFPMLGVNNDPLWPYLIFLQNLTYIPDFRITWSLCVEEHFYFIFPFMVGFIQKIKSLNWIILFFLCLLISGMIIRFFLWWHFRPDLVSIKNSEESVRIIYYYFYYPSYSRFDGLVLGVGLGALKIFFQRKWDFIMSHGNILVLASILALGGGVFLASNTFTSWLPDFFHAQGAPGSFGLLSVTLSNHLYSWSFTLLTASALSSKSWLNKLKIPGAETIALWSYAIYLIHYNSFKWAALLLGHFNQAQQGWIATLFTVLFTLTISFLIYTFIEQPCLKWRDQFLKRL